MEKFRTLVVLLGNENDEAGELSETAILRAQAAAEYVKAHADCLVLPTGAFGDHFNTSATPHGKLLALYLLGQGVSPDRILPSTKSSNTLEDAFGVLRALTSLAGIERVHIITSAFHMPRTRFIFGRVLQDYELSYQEACDPTDSAKRVRLQAHEKKALEKIRREWVDVANFDLGNFPTASYEGLGYELRHYDNISYLAIAGAFFLFGYLALGSFPQSGGFGYVSTLVSVVLVVLFWYLYKRLANTAAAARRVLSAIERLYEVPGISSTHHRTRFPGSNMSIQRTVDIIFLLLILLLLAQLIMRAI
ncbi:protein of unknown function DUF218 [Desulfurispirillum indicum S5]|uniref:DUF218 domain-containing protein n=1 Tax=Desulfurispirillum indicum (strain ATCC BAA-1389 / DSM 22839 / S5) TaxID=653733 RepID=E6W1A6_DESIS|nr:YdcF family protein [Desulfurispirillum indicum]ADU66526.1 protein of unknown function DUF218 [Desulfurispirillum indicum S5]